MSSPSKRLAEEQKSPKTPTKKSRTSSGYRERLRSYSRRDDQGGAGYEEVRENIDVFEQEEVDDAHEEVDDDDEEGDDAHEEVDDDDEEGDDAHEEVDDDDEEGDDAHEEVDDDDEEGDDAHEEVDDDDEEGDDALEEVDDDDEEGDDAHEEVDDDYEEVNHDVHEQEDNPIVVINIYNYIVIQQQPRSRWTIVMSILREPYITRYMNNN